MPPKANTAAGSADIYIVIHNNSVDSVYASSSSAHERATAMKDADSTAGSVKVELYQLKDGCVYATATAPTDNPSKKTKAEAPQANTAAKKTKTPAEQRAANADKSANKTGDGDLPVHVQTLLAGTGDALSGLTIVVTGVPPTLGRKNAEKLVVGYGGKLTKSLSQQTSLVVVGNDAGPKKLEQIEALGVETVDEDGLMERLERGGGGDGGGGRGKRGAEGDGKLAGPKKQRK